MGQCVDGHQVPGQLPGRFPGIRLLQPAVGHDDDESGHGADDVGIQEHPGSGQQSLFTGMPGIGGGGGHGDGPLPGLVTHQAPFHTLDQDGAEHTAEEGIGPEGPFKHCFEEEGDGIHVGHNQQDGSGYIHHGHHRHHGIGDLRDLPDAPEGQDGGADQDHCSRSIVEEGFRGDFHPAQHGADGSNGGDYVEPLGGQTPQGVKDVQQGKEDSHAPAAPEQSPAIEGQAPYEFPVPFFLEDLGQGGFHEGCGHTEEARDPHPEQGPGAPHRNRTGDPQDVPGSHPHGRAEHEGCQRRNPCFRTAPVSQDVKGLPHVGQLDEMETQGKIDP